MYSRRKHTTRTQARATPIPIYTPSTYLSYIHHGYTRVTKSGPARLHADKAQGLVSAALPCLA